MRCTAPAVWLDRGSPGVTLERAIGVGQWQPKDVGPTCWYNRLGLYVVRQLSQRSIDMHGGPRRSQLGNASQRQRICEKLRQVRRRYH
jgi:hypothetical protein